MKVEVTSVDNPLLNVGLICLRRVAYCIQKALQAQSSAKNLKILRIHQINRKL